MSPALADVPFRKVIQALSRAGFEKVRTKGSHEVFRDAAGRVVVVPKHHVVKRGTLASILRQAGLTVSEFRDLLK
ncbi:MAG: type II toxin-antitoxin system HicA family toxin [Natronosporangium sp.]